MLPWSEIIDPMAAQNGFAGVVSVDRGGEIEFVKAYGLAHRAHQIPNTIGTRFAIASGSKGPVAEISNEVQPAAEGARETPRITRSPH
jgi:CubicO group peptidase (beta-lactamase class C family)